MKHSHKKRKDSLKTWVVLINLCYVEVYRAAQNTGDHFQKNMTFSEGNRLFAVDFRANLEKQTLIWFNLQREGTGNGFSNIQNTFTESLQLQMSVLHQRKYVHL